MFNNNISPIHEVMLNIDNNNNNKINNESKKLFITKRFNNNDLQIDSQGILLSSMIIESVCDNNINNNNNRSNTNNKNNNTIQSNSNKQITTSKDKKSKNNVYLKKNLNNIKASNLKYTDRNILSKLNAYNFQAFKNANPEINSLKSSKNNYSNHYNKVIKTKSIDNNKQNDTVFEKLYNDAQIRKTNESKERFKRNNNNTNNLLNTNSMISSSIIYNSSIYPNNKSGLSNNINKTKEVIGDNNLHAYNNKGEAMYYKSLIDADKKYKKIEKLKQENLNKLNKLCTFKPVINNQKNIYNQFECNDDTTELQQINLKKNNKLIYDYSNYEKSKEELIKKLKEKHYLPDDSNENCTFKPYISDKSNNIINNFNSEEYLDKKLRKQERLIKECTKDYTFKPEINNVDNNFNKLKFNERQKLYNEISNNKRKELLDIYNPKIKDTKTGQTLYKPILISKMYSRNVQNIEKCEYNKCDIYELNYNYANKYNLKRKELLSKENALNVANSKPKLLKNNKTIYDNMKNEAMSNLYRILDSDMDDKISAYSINLKTLNKRTISILNPILKELKEENESLNSVEFMLAINHLFDVSVIYYMN